MIDFETQPRHVDHRDNFVLHKSVHLQPLNPFKVNTAGLQERHRFDDRQLKGANRVRAWEGWKRQVITFGRSAHLHEDWRICNQLESLDQVNAEI